ncbi:MAG: transposase [Micrococcales bacterium]|jgi:transposase|nr:transposase [Micrococcales bacterium]
MGYKFRGQDRGQGFLLPESMADWLPEDHLVFFIIEAVELVDVSQVLKRFRNDGLGGAPYDPRVLLAVLCYCYATGTVSSRQIERRCREDVACRIAAGNTSPDHVTICRFRRQGAGLFTSLFATVLGLCIKAGLVDPSLIAVDGTKLAANASREKSFDVVKLAKLLVKAAEAADLTEQVESDRKGPAGGGAAGLAKPGPDRVSRISRALEELKAEQAGCDLRHNRRPRQLGNTTDPDSRLMKTKQGYVQGYNAQAAVASSQVVVAADVSTSRTDYQLLKPMISQTETNLTALKIDTARLCYVADAGYLTSENAGLGNTVIAVGQGHHLSDKVKQKLQQAKVRDQVCRQVEAGEISSKQAAEKVGVTPGTMRNILVRWRRNIGGATGGDPVLQMAARLGTEEGKTTYKKRSAMVEPVFGQIKRSRGLSRLSVRGLGPVRGEWRLMCAVNNLIKLAKHASWSLIPATT